MSVQSLFKISGQWQYNDSHCIPWQGVLQICLTAFSSHFFQGDSRSLLVRYTLRNISFVCAKFLASQFLLQENVMGQSPLMKFYRHIPLFPSLVAEDRAFQKLSFLIWDPSCQSSSDMVEIWLLLLLQPPAVDSVLHLSPLRIDHPTERMCTALSAALQSPLPPTSQYLLAHSTSQYLLAHRIHLQQEWWQNQSWASAFTTL